MSNQNKFDGLPWNPVLIYSDQAAMRNTLTHPHGGMLIRILLSRYCFCLLLFYVLATSTVISGSIPTCDSVHSWQLCSVGSLGDQSASTMTRYYPDTEPTNHCPILIMSSAWLGSSTRVQSRDICMRCCYFGIYDRDAKCSKPP